MRAGLLGAFRRCNRGNVAMLFALSAVPMFGAAGMAIDYARAVDGRTQLQIALDGAVLAGAVNPGKEVATAQAFFDAAVAPAKLDGASASFDLASGALTGTARAVVPSTLLKVMHIDTVEIGANAAVQIGSKGGGVCILVLDPSGSQALLANSGAKINAPDCEIHVRSTANPAAIFNAGISLNVKKVCVKGANVIQNGGKLAVVEPSCAAIDDPFAGKLPTVSVPGNCTSPQPYNANGADVTLPQGNYCNLNINGANNVYMKPGLFQNVTFNGSSTKIHMDPGLYIFKDTTIVNSGSVMTGTGVTLYFADANSKIQFNGNVTLNLSAPTSGTYKGLLIYDLASSGTDWVVNGTAGYKLEGLIYLPKRNVTINSTSNVTADQLSMVVNRLILNNTDWKFSPSDTRPMGGSTGSIALIR